MFICNLSLNKSKLKKIIIWILAAVVILSIIFGIYTLANSSKANFVNDDIKASDDPDASAFGYAFVSDDTFSVVILSDPELSFAFTASDKS